MGARRRLSPAWQSAQRASCLPAWMALCGCTRCCDMLHVFLSPVAQVVGRALPVAGLNSDSMLSF